ncbi:CPBP family intramembrane glutamic endopeptidase [Clostridium estertheticum]|uniref:CPBP family intramembrane glutamic endopeptidase n=1 Tax=Clostridium estertheticum TaxID=238834 RepID=UPI001479154E|nr:CPBP family intramembrane glutamic endopeptidase [Clostridium estertheticum]MBZ9618259.1 CPBP family intramembrane metalloprotease [Clostridium estertheticum subsp. laramiense]
MRKNIQYSMFLHALLYYSALFLPLVVINIEMGSTQNFTGISIGIVVGILLIISNYKHNIKYISSKNYIIFNNIDLKEFSIQIFSDSYSVIGEEFFYRYFLIGFMYKNIGIYAVFLSTIVFIYSHFISRWANVTFNFRSYFYHGITGISFGLIFFYTKSILGCILAHLIFNMPQFIVIYKGYKNSKKKPGMIFDDYI